MGQVLTICLGMVKHTQRDRRRSVTLHDGESFNISFVMLKDEVKEGSFRLVKLYFALFQEICVRLVPLDAMENNADENKSFVVV